MGISEKSVLKKREDVIERYGEEELLLFHSSFGKLFEVNKVGKEVWKLCDGGNSVKQIKAKMSEKFGGLERIDADIDDFLNKLQELNLLEVLL